MYHDTEYTLNVFDRKIYISYASDARMIAAKQRVLLDEIERPQIACEGGYDMITFAGYKTYGEPGLFDSDILRYAYDHLHGQGNLRTYILSMSDEDKAWTEERNKGYTYTYYRKITLGEELRTVIRAEAERVIAEAERIADLIETAEREEAEREEAERKALLDGVTWDIDEQDIRDEGGRTTQYKHTITVDGETVVITERNIFDFGRVLNWHDCLLTCPDGLWIAQTYAAGMGWIDAPEQLSASGQRAAEIVSKYGKFARSGIRM